MPNLVIECVFYTCACIGCVVFCIFNATLAFMFYKETFTYITFVIVTKIAVSRSCASYQAVFSADATFHLWQYRIFKWIAIAKTNSLWTIFTICAGWRSLRSLNPHVIYAELPYITMEEVSHSTCTRYSDVHLRTHIFQMISIINQNWLSSKING